MGFAPAVVTVVGGRQKSCSGYAATTTAAAGVANLIGALSTVVGAPAGATFALRGLRMRSRQRVPALKTRGWMGHQRHIDEGVADHRCTRWPRPRNQEVASQVAEVAYVSRLDRGGGLFV